MLTSAISQAITRDAKAATAERAAWETEAVAEAEAFQEELQRKAAEDPEGGRHGFGASRLIFAEKKSIVFDFDGTIAEDVGFPEIGAPITSTIERMRKAKDAGIEVVIQSCRWSEHELNDAATAAEGLAQAKAWLAEHDVPYDRLEAGKPLGVAYVDDKAIRVEDTTRLDNLIEEMAAGFPVDGSKPRVKASSASLADRLGWDFRTKKFWVNVSTGSFEPIEGDHFDDDEIFLYPTVGAIPESLQQDYRNNR